MKLSNLLTLMGDSDQIQIYESNEQRLPGDEIFYGTVIECYKYPKLLKRKVTYLFAASNDMVIFVD